MSGGLRPLLFDLGEVIAGSLALEDGDWPGDGACFSLWETCLESLLENAGGGFLFRTLGVSP